MHLLVRVSLCTLLHYTFQEHTPFCICGASCDVPSVLEHWPNVLHVNWPFLQALTAGGAGEAQPAWADSCYSPSSCPLTVKPCAAPASPECQHSHNYLTLTSLCIIPQPRLSPRSFSFRRMICLYVANLHLSFVYVSRRLYFLQECHKVINFTAAGSELCHAAVNILPCSHIQIIILYFIIY